MLCKDKITAIFCIIDDILKEIYPVEDKRRKISDSEVILTAVLAAKNFYGNHSSAIRFVKEYGLIPNMLEESRFNRRLHQLGGILIEIFEFIASYFKEICCQMEYIIDSFPVEICKNIRINRSKIVQGKQWRGYTASMRTYFYGIKVQLITTKTGVPISFHFTAGKVADVKALDKILGKLPAESSLYGDSAYTNYELEDELFSKYGVFLKTQCKKNSKRIDNKEDSKKKTQMRKRIEVTISDIKKLFSRTIHAVTLKGFLLKVILYIFVNQLNNVI